MSWARRQLRRDRKHNADALPGGRVDPEVVVDHMDMVQHNLPTVLTQVGELEAHGKSIEDFVFFVADTCDSMGRRLAIEVLGNQTLISRSYPGKRPTLLVAIPLFDAVAILDKAGCHESGQSLLVRYPPRTMRIVAIAGGEVRLVISTPDQLSRWSQRAPP